MTDNPLNAGIPERDLAFEVAVMKRIERRRHVRGLALNVALGVAAMLLLALMVPHIALIGARDMAGAALLMIALLGLTLALQLGVARRA